MDATGNGVHNGVKVLPIRKPSIGTFLTYPEREVMTVVNAGEYHPMKVLSKAIARTLYKF